MEATSRSSEMNSFLGYELGEGGAAPSSIHRFRSATAASSGRGVSSAGGISPSATRRYSLEAAASPGTSFFRATSLLRSRMKLNPPSAVPLSPWQR